MPSIVDRVRLGIRVARHGLPGRSIKQFPVAWPASITGDPQWRTVDLDSYVTEGFSLNALIYSAIMYKARAVTTAPLRAYTGDHHSPDPSPDSDLESLLRQPNSHQTMPEWLQQFTVYWNLAGESFTWKFQGDNGLELFTLRPDRVFIIPQGRQLMGYLYVPKGKTKRDGIPILPEDMLHPKLPNPADPLEGMGYGFSPLAPLAQSGDVDNEITKHLKLFFERGAVLPGVIETQVERLSPDQIAEIQEAWEHRYGSSEKWWKIGVLEKGASYKPISPPFNEMGFSAIDERNEGRIIGPFGVPGVLLGTRMGLERSIYSNWQEARTQFWQDTFVPELNVIEAELQSGLSTDNVFPKFDTSRVPALQKDIPALVEAAVKMIQYGTPPNVAYETVGLDVPDLPQGDEGYLPISLIPIGTTPVTPQLVDSTASRKDDVWEAQWKFLQWKAFDTIARAWEEPFGDEANRQFEREKRVVLAEVNAEKTKALAEKRSIEWLIVNDAVQQALEESGEEWRSAFLPLLEGLLVEQLEDLNVRFGMEFDVRNLLAEQWFRDYTLVFAQPINKTTTDTLGVVFEQAMREGWSIPTMSDNIGTLFEQWMFGNQTSEDFEWYEQRLPPHRRELIARMETMRASNAGATELYDKWGVQERDWLSTRDDRVRETHLAADGQRRGIREAFDVGGAKLMQPGDPSAPLSETANCRCTTVPVIRRR